MSDILVEERKKEGKISAILWQEYEDLKSEDANYHCPAE